MDLSEVSGRDKKPGPMEDILAYYTEAETGGRHLRPGYQPTKMRGFSSNNGLYKEDSTLKYAGQPHRLTAKFNSSIAVDKLLRDYGGRVACYKN